MAAGNVKTLSVVKYALLPQFLPRIAALLFSGFHYFAFFMAQIYRGARLLPAAHPYLNPAEIGNYSIPDVIAAAGRHLEFKRENIDQVIIYFAMLIGLILMAMQAFFLLVSLFAPQAMALSLSYYFGNDIKATLTDSFGNNVDNTQDLAFILLDRVFGVPGIFDSCVSTAVDCYRSTSHGAFESGSTVYVPATFPWPYHYALQEMFNFYSVGLLIIGMIIILYFVIVIVAETAQTGTPFGKRFNKLWAPIRLVVALGLLIPISNGLNSAQYITLYAAKIGSNFGTNGWLVFNAELTNGLPTGTDDVIAKPSTPSPRELLQFMMLAHACKAIEEGYVKAPFNDKWTSDPACNLSTKDQQYTYVDAYLVKQGDDVATDNMPLSTTSYADALTFFDKGDIRIRFGDRGCTSQHNRSEGHVIPLCGELNLSNSSVSNTNIGAFHIQSQYYMLVSYLWGDYNNPGTSGEPDAWYPPAGSTNSLPKYCNASELSTMEAGQKDKELWKRSLYYVQQTCPSPQDTTIMTEPDINYLGNAAMAYRVGDNTPGTCTDTVTVAGSSPGISNAVVEQIIRVGTDLARDDFSSGTGNKYQISTDLLARGWGGAGMWYNQIAEMNGVLTAAAWELPKVTLYPQLMNDVMVGKMRSMKNINLTDVMSGGKSGDTSLLTNRQADKKAIEILGRTFTDWLKMPDPSKPQGGNAVTDFINYMFGTQGLFDMRDACNQNVNPLALLTALGKGLVEASIRNIMIGMGGQGMQILATAGGMSAVAEGAKAISGIAYNIATMTLTAGFILYYVLPFLPFVYFFFALGNWIKGIFEAMVGVPLWALAHIRIDGDGLPGSAALNGYYMIFEIFLRPILIVFGLIASVSIFGAMASVFNAVFPLAVNNLGGLNYNNAGDATWLETARGPVDQLFYTVMYAVIMYIMALSSFKLIDLIPGSILRWMGSGVTAFNGGDGDVAGNLTNYAAVGGTQITSQTISGIKGLGDGATSVVAAAKSSKG